MAASERRTFRCAIYTRKSTEHGLEQDFNSLDAQREAAEAYIKSQAHEGWKLIKKPLRIATAQIAPPSRMPACGRGFAQRNPFGSVMIIVQDFSRSSSTSR